MVMVNNRKYQDKCHATSDKFPGSATFLRFLCMSNNKNLLCLLCTRKERIMHS
uniref:Uncharacterized protein n=1 Tax=Arundo donax TaxID=35708 RepID=A0A0A9AJ41_ARUDO